ncbi:LuxR C-terminal-related transcriptional regulator [Geodermatophilus sp. SYSU D01045]
MLDEQEVVRRGVIQVLAGDAGMTVVAEAASVGEAVARGRAVRPDVAVIGMRLPDGTGAEACTRLRADVPGVRCLVLSQYVDPETVAAAVRAGVSGYLVKHVRGPALTAAVRRVAAGGTVFAPEVTALLDPRGGAGRPDPLAGLTERERAVLLLIGDGLTNRQIGDRLGLAEKTVKNYVTNMLPKLGLQRRTQAAVLVTQLRSRGADGALPSADVTTPSRRTPRGST